MAINILGYIYLDEDDIKKIHTRQLVKFGGSDGLRSPEGLSSAVGQPQMTFGGDDLYPDVFSKAAILAYCLAENQVFVDGNKRTALVAALTFLKVNGYAVPPAEDRLYDAMIKIANKEMTKEQLSALLKELSEEFNSK